MRFSLLAPLAALTLLLAAPARAEDGYDLWLRYPKMDAGAAARYQPDAAALVSAGTSPTIRAARDELARGLSGLLGRTVPVSDSLQHDGAVLFGTPANSPTIAGLNLPLDKVGTEGFVIRSVTAKGRKAIVIAANTDAGVLYGAFRFLSLLQTRQSLDSLDIVAAPRLQNWLLNHWDRQDRTIERGYAGFSIFDWWKLPDYLDPRYTDYARANASVGINGAVLNNVNAKADWLEPRSLEKVAALAGVLRVYGMKVYLCARFSAPMESGGLKTADPLDPAVQAWWKKKADEIYTYIPDFGGFLVKANSEGQPGPGDYKRSHADGANMLADALKPHGGIVMWRAFVYSNEVAVDRVMQPYNEFVPLDGTFRDNVLIQAKNGALDFQPREPFHPLFGAMRKTPVMLEVQLSKEYLGFATHLVNLGALYSEVLNADTFAKGPGTTVAKVIDGEAFGYARTGIAAMSNIGDDRNWCGSQFGCADWYAYGRLAWDPSASPETLAREWLQMTYTGDKAFVKPVLAMMLASREAVVDYMTPLGLSHQMATGHHYGPGPWVDDAGRDDWNPVYYNRADAGGIGFDRTATGSNAVAQYAPPVAAAFGSIDKVPENFLLWFHHVPWDHKMKSDRTLWDELVIRYQHGVDTVHAMRATWAAARPYVDAQRFAETQAFLAIQEKEARWWRDASIAYFQSVSKRPLPAGIAPPPHDLQYYKNIDIPYAPGRSGN